MEASQADRCVAVVDDDVSARAAIRGVLKSVGLHVEAFASAEEFLASEQLQECACLVTDVQMPGISGLQLQARLLDEGKRIPIIFVSAHGDRKSRDRAMNAGAVGFLDKPFDDNALIDIVKGTLEG